MQNCDVFTVDGDFTSVSFIEQVYYVPDTKWLKNVFGEYVGIPCERKVVLTHVVVGETHKYLPVPCDYDDGIPF